MAVRPKQRDLAVETISVLRAVVHYYDDLREKQLQVGDGNREHATASMAVADQMLVFSIDVMARRFLLDLKVPNVNEHAPIREVRPVCRNGKNCSSSPSKCSPDAMMTAATEGKRWPRWSVCRQCKHDIRHMVLLRDDDALMASFTKSSRLPPQWTTEAEQREWLRVQRVRRSRRNVT